MATHPLMVGFEKLPEGYHPPPKVIHPPNSEDRFEFEIEWFMNIYELLNIYELMNIDEGNSHPPTDGWLGRRRFISIPPLGGGWEIPC